jgi:hypothetical protein
LFSLQDHLEWLGKCHLDTQTMAMVWGFQPLWKLRAKILCQHPKAKMRDKNILPN